MDRIIDTLRELGAGFAFVGRQVHFDVDGDDFYADLIFFHTEQLRYVVIAPTPAGMVPRKFSTFWWSWWLSRNSADIGSHSSFSTPCR